MKKHECNPCAESKIDMIGIKDMNKKVIAAVYLENPLIG